jgi:hypothetical protein
MSTESDETLVNALATGVGKYCDLVYRSQPRSIAAAQALDLLANFAPLGTLPGQPVNPLDVIVARGHIVNAWTIARSIGLDASTTSDVWTWLSLCSTLATSKLEDHAIFECREVFEARAVSDMMAPFLSVDTEPYFSARLALCERIARLTVIFEALAAFKQALLALFDNMFHDAQCEIRDTLSTARNSFEEISQRFRGLCCRSLVFALLTSGVANQDRISSVGAASGNIRRLSEEGKVQRYATITLIAASLFQASPTNPPETDPSTPSTSERVKQRRYESAMANASDSYTISRWFSQNQGSPMSQTVTIWARDRIEGIEEMFVAFAELDSPSEDGSRALAPWHHLAAIVMEGTNVLLDLQAAHIVNTGTTQSPRQKHRMSRRAYMMRQVSRTMRKLEGKESNTISVMCSNLVGSMARIYDARLLRVQQEVPQGIDIEPDSSQEVSQGSEGLSDSEVFRRMCEFLNEPYVNKSARFV